MIHGIIDDQRKMPSGLRKKLQSAGFANSETLVHQRGNPVTFPTGKVGWSGREELADVRRCPISPMCL